jgi:hypothetical protein
MRPGRSQEQLLFNDLFGQQSRRHFLRRAGVAGLSASALAAMLEACGSSSTGSSATTANVNINCLLQKQKACPQPRRPGLQGWLTAAHSAATEYSDHGYCARR